MGQMREPPPASTSHAYSKPANTVASPRSSVPMPHSHPSHSEAPRLPSHKPRRHTLSASPIVDASCIKQPKEYLHSRRDKQSSDLHTRISYDDAISYSCRVRQSSTATSYMPSHTGGLGTSTNHHPTFVYIPDRHSAPTELMSPEQDACALFIEDAAKHHFSPPVEQRFGFSPSCYVPPELRVENNQHTWCVFEPPLLPEKHNYIAQLLTSELTPSFSSNTHLESVVLLDAGVNRALPPIFRSPLPFRDRNILIEKAHNKGLGMFARRKLVLAS